MYKTQVNAIKKVDFEGIYHKIIIRCIRCTLLFVNGNGIYIIAWICSNVIMYYYSSESNLHLNVVIMMENARYKKVNNT